MKVSLWIKDKHAENAGNRILAKDIAVEKDILFHTTSFGGSCQVMLVNIRTDENLKRLYDWMQERSQLIKGFGFPNGTLLGFHIKDEK